MSPAAARFLDLHREHVSHVRAIARRFVRTPAEVDDLVQDVFLQVWKQLDRYDAARGDERAWLGSIARTRALDRLRRQSTRTRAVSPGGPIAANQRLHPCVATDPLERADAAARLHAAWADLPPDVSRVLELVYVDDLSQRQIASLLGETLGVVKSRVRQGLLALRRGCGTGRLMPAPAGESECLPLTTTTAMAAGPALPSLAGLHITLIDDDPRTRRVMSALMTCAGGTAVTCESGTAALEILPRTCCDVLVVDVNMPGLDGFDLIRAVRRMAAPLCDVPAIAFTGRAAEADRAGALLAGFQVHMSKPVHPLAVLSAIRQLSDRGRSSQMAVPA